MVIRVNCPCKDCNSFPCLLVYTRNESKVNGHELQCLSGDPPPGPPAWAFPSLGTRASRPTDFKVVRWKAQILQVSHCKWWWMGLLLHPLFNSWKQLYYSMDLNCLFHAVFHPSARSASLDSEADKTSDSHGQKPAITLHVSGVVPFTQNNIMWDTISVSETFLEALRSDDGQGYVSWERQICTLNMFQLGSGWVTALFRKDVSNIINFLPGGRRVLFLELRSGLLLTCQVSAVAVTRADLGKGSPEMVSNLLSQILHSYTHCFRARLAKDRG